MAKLFLLPDAPDNEPFELLEPLLVIGRSSESTLQVEDNNVSKFHALLVKTEGGHRIFDLHSANSTFVNDHRVTSVMLKNNDVIRIGPALFRFETEIAPAAVASSAIPSKVRLRTGPTLGRKPAGSATPIPVQPSTPPAVPATSQAPTVIEAPILSASAQVPKMDIPVAEPTTISKALPLKKEEQRVSIRIPEAKKTVLAPPPTPISVSSDAKETQANVPVAAPESKPRLGFGLKRTVPAEPSPIVPTSLVTPSPAPTPVPAAPPPAPTSSTTLGGPKPPGAERTLRPQLGGSGGSGGLKLKK